MVIVVAPETLPDAAVMLVEPVATDVASALEPVALLTDATSVTDELQTTSSVMSFIVPSEKFPIAANCCSVPIGMTGFVGVTSIETMVADVTVRVVLPEALPTVAVMVAEPAATEVAIPLEPVSLLTDATPVFDELHDT